MNPSSLSKATVAKKHSSAKKEKSSSRDNDVVVVNEKQLAILRTIVKLRRLGIHAPIKQLVQLLSGNVQTKPGFDKNLGYLRKQGLVDFPGPVVVSSTDKGITHVGTVDPSDLTSRFCLNCVKQLFARKIRPLFDIMSDGNEHNKLTVARRLGYDMDKLSGFEKELGSMVKIGYLMRDGDMVQLTDKCFPFGRADGA